MKKKSNNGLTLAGLRPHTDAQAEAFTHFESGHNLLMTGPAGVGKTIVAMYLALREVAQRRLERVIVIRSVVPSRDIGFLPGGLEEKISLYEQPYEDACSQLYGRDDAYQCLKLHRSLEFMSTSFARGINLRDAALFIDEASNMTYHEIDTMITRACDGTRVIICGDSKQSDLVDPQDRKGFSGLRGVVAEMPSFRTVEFGVADVRRSGLVQEYLEARMRVLSW